MDRGGRYGDRPARGPRDYGERERGGRERERDRDRDRDRDRGGYNKRRRSQSPGRYRRFNRDEKFERHRREHHGRRTYGQMRDNRTEETLTYKQFIAQLDEDVTPEEAERQYSEYKRGQAVHEKKQFFLRRKDDPELMRKYNPDTIAELLARGCELAKCSADTFMRELDEGRLDPLVVSVTGAKPVANNDDEGGEWDDDDNDADAPSKRTRRSDEEEELVAKVAPAVAWEPSRLEHDLGVTLELCKKLDEERKLDTVLPAKLPLDLETEKRLDIVMAYLWRVHGIDYYGGIEPEGYGNLHPRDPSRHLRRDSDRDLLNAGIDEPAVAAMMAAGRTWEETVDATWQHRLGLPNPYVALGVAKVEQTVEDFVAGTVTTIVEGQKYGCTLSDKMFKGPEYVHKHVRNKHAEKVAAIRAKIVDEVYMQNFLDDSMSMPQLDGQGGMGPDLGMGYPGAFDGRGDYGDREADYGPGGKYPEGGLGEGTMLVPAPGAGPLGPFVPVPMSQMLQGRGGSMEMAMEIMSGGPPVMPMGGRGGRGRGRGRGGRKIMSYNDYVDLDAAKEEAPPVIDYRNG